MKKQPVSKKNKGQSKVDIDQIHCVQIRLLSQAYSVPDDILPKLGERIDYGYSIVKMINHGEKIIRIIFQIRLKTEVEKGKNAEFNQSTELLFKIDNLNELIKSTKENISVDKGLDETICAITYSTIRGLLSFSTQGTIFASFILPVIKASDINLKAAKK